MKNKKYLATFTYQVEIKATNVEKAEELAYQHYESFIENVRDLDFNIQEILPNTK